jgi:fucose 4-O-acetylase-like acetyltransferase
MKERDIYYDNVKAIMIFLVVFSHFTNLNKENLLYGGITNVICTFIMPVFIFISGYFSKKITSHRYAEISRLLYPFIVFQILNLIFTKTTGLGYASKNLFIPAYQNWYLIGLFIWRLLIPYFTYFNKTFLLILMIVFSLLIGFVDEFSIFLGFYRVFYFFPFFIMGYFSPDIQQVYIRYPRLKPALVLFFLFGAGSVFYLSNLDPSYNDIIYASYTPYDNFQGDINLFYGRIIGFFTSILFSMAVLSIISRKNQFYTYFGKNSLLTFLCHMFIVFPVNHFWPDLSPVYSLVSWFLFSLIICFVFSSGIILKATESFVNLDVLLSYANKLREKGLQFKQ